MPSLKGLGIIGTGGLGVLAAGLILSNILKTGTEGLFGTAMLIFVIAGAIALIARVMR
ncbi:MAG: hypothetical protein V1837_06670 [Candidatus Woesearchaeota archaeon]